MSPQTPVQRLARIISERIDEFVLYEGEDNERSRNAGMHSKQGDGTL